MNQATRPAVPPPQPHFVARYRRADGSTLTRPVVTWTHDGNPMVVQDDTGRLVRADSAAALPEGGTYVGIRRSDSTLGDIEERRKATP